MRVVRNFGVDKEICPPGIQCGHSGLRASCERTLTDKGRAYQLEIRGERKREFETKLRKHIEIIYSLMDSRAGRDVLEKEMENLDSIKEELNVAHRAFDALLEEESAKGAAYRDFDLCDREYAECRIRISERLRSIEQQMELENETSVPDAKSTKSSRSGKTKMSRSSRSSAMSKRVEAAARAAKLKVEMKYLEHDTNLRRIQLEKEIALADAEEEAIRLAMNDQAEASRVARSNTDMSKESRESAPKTEIEAGMLATGHKSSTLRPEASSFEPMSSPVGAIVKQEQRAASEETTRPQDSILQQMVKLQAKQAELSAQFVSQQRASTLPAQEPPVFSGNYFDYPTFIAAFEAMIDKKVDSQRDRLYFLCKYTSGKAHEVIKGFLTWNSNRGYEEARKLLAQRFGSPFRVAEAYKSRLRSWSQIAEGDDAALQDFSDFLVRCEGAMQSMKYMEELNSPRILQEISSKLPIKSGSKWCREARDILRKTDRTVSFHDLVVFVKEEADLANDPIFSPEALKRERTKMPDRNRGKRAHGANSFVSLASQSQSNESRRKSSEVPSQKQRTNLCSVCNGGHQPDKCAELRKGSVEERIEIARSKGLCFGCLKKGRQSKNCRARLICEKCGRQHPTSLHIPNDKEQNKGQQSTPQLTSSDFAHSHQTSSEVADENENSKLTANVCSAVDWHGVITNSLIIPVFVHHKNNPGNKVMIYA